jgi:hypothetical protein
MWNKDKDKIAAELRKHYNGECWLGEIIEAFEDHHEGMYMMFINQHRHKISGPIADILSSILEKTAKDDVVSIESRCHNCNDCKHQ